MVEFTGCDLQELNRHSLPDQRRGFSMIAAEHTAIFDGHVAGNHTDACFTWLPILPPLFLPNAAHGVPAGNRRSGCCVRGDLPVFCSRNPRRCGCYAAAIVDRRASGVPLVLITFVLRCYPGCGINPVIELKNGVTARWRVCDSRAERFHSDTNLGGRLVRSGQLGSSPGPGSAVQVACAFALLPTSLVGLSNRLSSRRLTAKAM